jgi:hypothetical protein
MRAAAQSGQRQEQWPQNWFCRDILADWQGAKLRTMGGATPENVARVVLGR